VVEQLIPLAEKAALPMTHLAMAFAIAHPGVTSAIIGRAPCNSSTTGWPAPYVTLDDEILDRIDEIAPPGTDAGPKRRVLHPVGVVSERPPPRHGVRKDQE
jgi:aryl-alcohol dehydrogenase-like predicted oxidoreductase